MTANPDDQPKGASSSRPLEIEEPLNRRLIHPLSRRLVTLLIPTGITPNAVSVFGVVAAGAAAAAYAATPFGLVAWPIGALVGFALHLGWHVLDGADGDLARRTGRSSPSGEIVDGICDYLAHFVVYLVFAILLFPEIGHWAWPLALAAGLSRAIQANHYESARRNYQWWAHGTNWIRQTMSVSSPANGGFKASLARGYLKVSGLVSAEDAEMDRLHAAAIASSNATAARNLYANAQRGLVKRASWLGALHETQAIFVSMLAGSPIFFFTYEVVVLNLVVIWSLRAQRRVNAALKPQIAALIAG